GVFAVYSYNKGLQFHGRTMPDQITIYLAGAAVVEAQMVGIEDASPSDESSLKPGSGMVDDGPPSMGMNQRFPMVVGNAQATIDKPSIVHVIIDKQGNVVEAELSAAADVSLGDAAMNLVRNN